ncbi:MAG: phosphoglucosamine mutase [Clostridiales bacterium]|nr:MAG: phosphoglucosamine mutase [Clostridiales bacterium]
MGRYFGTDGIRGVVNKALTHDLAFRCGAACGYLLKQENANCKVIIGSDTRASKDMLMGALICGFTYSGVNVEHIGVLPTPALAFLIDRMGAQAGVMISASHNPYEYNGIKILTKGGIKLPDEKEEEIESLIDPFEIAPAEKPGQFSYNLKAKDFYCEHIKQACEEDISGFKIILDCSNGATSETAHRVFEDLGVDARIYHDKPNGFNINEGCGSMHMEELAAIVRRKEAEIGFAFDGDADRCLACDSQGRIIDGDKILAVIALYLKGQGRLKKNTLVATVMSNLGLVEKMNQNGINVPTTRVGDRYVLEEMMEQDYVLGGEHSGHIIFLEKATTGDGQLTAIMLLCAMKALHMTGEDVYNIFTPYPQAQINVNADDLQKKKLMADEVFQRDVQKAEAAFSGHGRILVRPSGTEPYIRILVEGPEEELVASTAKALEESTSIRLSQLF